MTMSQTDLVERLRAATMRFDWGDLPDDAAIPAVPLLREAAAELASLRAELEQVKGDMRMVVSHATMGRTAGDGMSVNDISVKITALRNELFKDAMAAGAKDARAELKQLRREAVELELRAYWHPVGAIWRIDNYPAGIDFSRDGWVPLYARAFVEKHQ
jgi:hypothetical protein